MTIAVLSGLGGLFLVEKTPFSLVVAMGGLAGGVKALFDLARHTVQERQILRVYWRVREQKTALARQLAERGLMFEADNP